MQNAGLDIYRKSTLYSKSESNRTVSVTKFALTKSCKYVTFCFNNFFSKYLGNDVLTLHSDLCSIFFFFFDSVHGMHGKRKLSASDLS